MQKGQRIAASLPAWRDRERSKRSANLRVGSGLDEIRHPVCFLKKAAPGGE